MGVRAVKGYDGRVLAQDATTSQAFDMPRASIATGCVDFVLPLDRLGTAIVALVTAPGAAELFRVPLPPWATPAL
jgi:two-component system chemotaxis response regulator CheB